MAPLPTYTTLGSGPTVLMLHDADGGYLTFAPQVETLASTGYRAVAWDMPGYGRSSPIGAYTLKGLAQSCVALMDALQCGPAVLVGHGLGALVAIEVALRHPDRVRRLVLCAGGLPADAAWVDQGLGPRLAALDAVDAGGSMQQLAQVLVPRYVGSGALPEGVRLATHALSQVYPSMYRRALAVLAQSERRADALAHLYQPTLVVGGDQDRAMPPAALQALAEVLPDAQHVSLAHVGHWPQLEDPDSFEEHLLGFLREHHSPRRLH